MPGGYVGPEHLKNNTNVKNAAAAKERRKRKSDIRAFELYIF